MTQTIPILAKRFPPQKNKYKYIILCGQHMISLIVVGENVKEKKDNTLGRKWCPLVLQNTWRSIHPMSRNITIWNIWTKHVVIVYRHVTNIITACMDTTDKLQRIILLHAHHPICNLNGYLKSCNDVILCLRFRRTSWHCVTSYVDNVILSKTACLILLLADWIVLRRRWHTSAFTKR